MVVFKFGSPTWARTRDLRINSPSLYRLSYQGIEERIIFINILIVKKFNLKIKGKRIKWLILPLHESETDRHLIGLSG